jgi:hypothetical protein
VAAGRFAWQRQQSEIGVVAIRASTLVALISILLKKILASDDKKNSGLLI